MKKVLIYCEQCKAEIGDEVIGQIKMPHRIDVKTVVVPDKGDGVERGWESIKNSQAYLNYCNSSCLKVQIDTVLNSPF
jgi:hypothetical protein